MNWTVFFNILEIVVAVALMVVVLLQNRGAGLGGVFGQQTAVFRTRRGLERVLFRATIGLSILFVITSLASVRAHSTAAANVPPFDINSVPLQPPVIPPDSSTTPSASSAGDTPPAAAPANPPAAEASPAVPAASPAADTPSSPPPAN